MSASLPRTTGLVHVGNARTALYNWLFAPAPVGLFCFALRIPTSNAPKPAMKPSLLRTCAGWGWIGTKARTEAGVPEKGACGPLPAVRAAGHLCRAHRAPAGRGQGLSLFLHGRGTGSRARAGRSRAPAPDLLRPLPHAGTRRRSSGTWPPASLLRCASRIEDHPLRFHDLVRGTVEFAAETVSDPILVRSASGGAGGVSAGVPVYNYVVTVDDALMGITHGHPGRRPHLQTRPSRVAIYQAFGWPVPEFAHLSTILGADRERLSKRHGATSISNFREMGYLPEALVELTSALLGWGAEDGKTEDFYSRRATEPFHWSALRRRRRSSTSDQAQLAQPALSQAGRAGAGRRSGLGVFRRAPDRAGHRHGCRQILVRALAGTVVPAVDHLDQLPAKAASRVRLRHQCSPCQRGENAAVLAADSARTVLGEMASRIRAPLRTSDSGDFQGLDERGSRPLPASKAKSCSIPSASPSPALTRAPSSDKLLPLIEEGAALGLGIPQRTRTNRGVCRSLST